MLNIVELAPIPSASVRMATAVEPGVSVEYYHPVVGGAVPLQVVRDFIAPFLPGARLTEFQQDCVGTPAGVPTGVPTNQFGRGMTVQLAAVDGSENLRKS